MENVRKFYSSLFETRALRDGGEEKIRLNAMPTLRYVGGGGGGGGGTMIIARYDRCMCCHGGYPCPFEL